MKPIQVLEWSHRAACKGFDPEWMFADGAEARYAKKVCRGCPVVNDCLAYALDQRIDFGVWGGMTARERRAMRRAAGETLKRTR